MNKNLKMQFKNKYNLCRGKKNKYQNIIKKNPSAAASLRGTIYEEKIINLIKEKSKQTKKTISVNEAEKILKDHHKAHHHSDNPKSEKSKKAVKSSKKLKKIRKK